MFHLVPHQTDIGIGVEYASATFGYLILAGFFGSLAVGIGAQHLSALTMLALVQGTIACCSIGLWTLGDGPSLRCWAALHGLAAAGYAPLTAMVMAELFGVASPRLGGTIGLAFLVAMTGVYLGNAGSGWAHDAAGTYLPVWKTFSALSFLSLAPLAALLARPARLVRPSQA
jgi:MFS family permease